jgi:competence ComEA-like helix-hairpin-helix protein
VQPSVRAWLVALPVVTLVAAWWQAPSVGTQPDPARALPTAAASDANEDDHAHAQPSQARTWLLGQRIDVNRATQGDLERIHGVGPHMAERILQLRTERGGFRSIDELDDVDGVGPKKLATLKAALQVGEAAP